MSEGDGADLVIFNELRIAGRVTFEQPTQMSVGIDAVFINGRLACAQGESRDVHAGMALQRIGN